MLGDEMQIGDGVQIQLRQIEAWKDKQTLEELEKIQREYGRIGYNAQQEHHAKRRAQAMCEHQVKQDITSLTSLLIVGQELIPMPEGVTVMQCHECKKLFFEVK